MSKGVGKWLCPLLAALMLSGAGIAAGEEVFFVSSDGTLVEVTDANRVALFGIPNKAVETVVAHDITWNLDYQDAGTGIGFDDAALGAQRKATLELAISYISDVVNEPGGVVDLNVQSQNVNSGTLASAGPLVSGFFNNPAINNGMVFQHIMNGAVDPSGETGSPVPDGQMKVNFFHNFNLGSGAPASGATDLYSVLVHELTHALGFLRAISFLAGTGQLCVSGAPRADGVGWFGDSPGEYPAFDTFLRTGNGNPFLTNFTYVGNASYFTGGDNGVRFTGPQAAASFGSNPPIYAPGTFACGSSLSHWDSGIIPQGAVMEPSIPAATQRRAFAAFEIAALRDLGYNNAAPAEGGEGEGEGECGPVLTGACPNFDGEGTLLENPPFNLDWENGDVDGTGIVDRWEVALLERVICGGAQTASLSGAACAFEANLETLRTEAVFGPLNLVAVEDAIAAGLTVSTEFQTFITTAFSLAGDYTVYSDSAKAAGEPLSPQGDPDGDGLSNLAEYTNTVNASLSMDDYTEAALSPLLDGTSSSAALPVGAPMVLGAGIMALAAAGAAALRRKQRS